MCETGCNSRCDCKRTRLSRGWSGDCPSSAWTDKRHLKTSSEFHDRGQNALWMAVLIPEPGWPHAGVILTTLNRRCWCEGLGKGISKRDLRRSCRGTAKTSEVLSHLGRLSLDGSKCRAHDAARLERPEWRNWQTRWIQNPVRFTPRVGSSPTFGT